MTSDSTSKTPIIEIRNVTKIYGSDVKAVDNVSLEVNRGEFFALLGPSGCGKTTLLRMLAGFETPTEGAVIIDGQNMGDVQANRRPVNMVFQSYAVFPHMSVAQNVGYGLKIDRVPRKEINKRVEEALDLVKLGGLGNRMPDELSGGQRQRVALARALVKRPSVLLLDEPLSALDAKLREAMQLELVRLQKTVGITFVIVTHDQAEALSMANRIAVMEAGVVRQVAGPNELYEHPTSRFVADFIGQINMFEGTASTAGDGKVKVGTSAFNEAVLSGTATGKVAIAVRPEKVSISRDKPSDTGTIAARGRMTDIAYYGGFSNVFVDIGADTPVLAEVSNSGRNVGPGYTQGEEVWVSFKPENTLLFDH
ncbi:MAG: ABC transporter ATP-binding protein [Alphaproteobacteria bacterium]|nr:ABC transporter ATP-binding protein [Alphaproteobacteria bacterium]MBO6629859.1 ABC transporter ATP-binding protein [Alphaproteobacteria bacterium]MDF1626190.1 ABC transporter ATP-binding protein [Parvibaculaceae bacterium]